MILGVSGFIGSGKNSVAEILIKEFGFVQDSFASSLKDICSQLFDWPRELIEGDTTESREWRETVDIWWADKLNIPNFSPRLALQLVGTDSLRNHFNPDLWLLTFANRIRKNPDKNIVISDVRFPNELKFIKENNGILTKVNRGENPVWYSTALKANTGCCDKCKAMMEIHYASVHLSEWAWVGSAFDYEIDNNGTLEDLRLQIKDIVSKVI